MISFCQKYGFQSNEIKIVKTNNLKTLNNIIRFMNNKKFIVIIDEFDRIVNDLMISDPQSYENMIIRDNDMKPIESKNPIKSFMVELKRLSTQVDFTLFQTYIFGVSPLAISDVSGYNIPRDLSFRQEFSELCCFDESEVDYAINSTQILTNNEFIQVKKVIMNNFNYIKLLNSNKLFINPTLLLEFLDELNHNLKLKTRILTNNLRKNDLISTNVMIGQSAINVILKSKHSKSIIFNLLNNGSEIIDNINNILYLPEICSINNIDNTNRQAIVSFLYYNGILTIRSENNNQIELELLNNPIFYDLITKLQYYIKDL